MGSNAFDMLILPLIEGLAVCFAAMAAGRGLVNAASWLWNRHTSPDLRPWH